MSVAIALTGGSPAARAIEPPSLLPSGAFVAKGPPRPSAGPHERRVCSLREPICVHGPGDLPPRALLALLASAERAWETETQALGLPVPDADLETDAYDVYVVHGVGEGALTLAGERDPRSRIDRASAYTLVDASLALGESCARDTAVAAAVARASLFRVSPATDEGSARAEVAYFARLAVPCAATRLDGIDVFQRSPERAFADPSAPGGAAPFSRGASLFYWWLDASFGPDDPGGLVRALWSLSATTTPLAAERWVDEPDGFDVLRESFKDVITSGSRVEDLLSEFGTTRALLGPRDNGQELPEARALGAALAPRIDWTIDWPSTPRRLASPLGLGVAATGSGYVLVHHAGAPAGSRLRVEAAWEQHAALRWTVVKLDAAGHELGRVPIGAPARATEAQATITDLDAVDSLLVVATNVGDPYVPFEPDDEGFEPHAWLVTLAAQ